MYATKISVIKYNGNKIAIASFGGKAKTITGKPKEPNAPPNPDFDIATRITERIAIGIKISNWFISFKLFNVSSINL